MKVDFFAIKVEAVLPQIDLIDKVKCVGGKVAKLKVELVETDTDSYINYLVDGEVVSEESLLDFTVYSFKPAPHVNGDYIKPPSIKLSRVDTKLSDSIWFAEYNKGFAQYLGVGLNKDAAINYLIREYTRHRKIWEK